MPDLLSTDIDTEEDFIEAEAKLYYLQLTKSTLRNMTFEPHCINSSLTIKDALVALNNLRNATLTLFVLNDNAQIIGTLTDGDIRRALVNGHGLDCTLDKVMHRDYKFIRQKEFTVANLRSFRDRRIMFIPILDGENHVVDVVNLQKFKSKLPIDAVLMAGGKGERLRPLTEKTPKPLLEVGGKCTLTIMLIASFPMEWSTSM